jgi:protein-tyrosine-phosphatase
VLFVCRGNTCRSPLARAFFVREAQSRRRTDVAAISAGVDVGGEPEPEGASAKAREAASEHGLDLSGHEATALTPAMLARADRVFVMERSQAERITSLLPEEAGHVELLDPEGAEIPDPAGEGVEAYRRTAERIRRAVRERAGEVLGADETDTGGAAA